jgi:hypothetical protein
MAAWRFGASVSAGASLLSLNVTAAGYGLRLHPLAMGDPPPRATPVERPESNGCRASDGGAPRTTPLTIVSGAPAAAGRWIRIRTVRRAPVPISVTLESRSSGSVRRSPDGASDSSS